MPNTVIFHHLPKTAGVSVSRAVGQAFPGRCLQARRLEDMAALQALPGLRAGSWLRRLASLRPDDFWTVRPLVVRLRGRHAEAIALCEESPRRARAGDQAEAPRELAGTFCYPTSHAFSPAPQGSLHDYSRTARPQEQTGDTPMASRLAATSRGPEISPGGPDVRS
jgi:hypothetical protein